MFDPNKPVVTREGKPARIVSTNMGGRYPILAIIDEGQEGDHAARYTMKGRFMSAPGETAFDLINVPDTTENVIYVNIGKGFGSVGGARESAPGWPVVKLTLKVGTAIGLEDVREVVSAELA